MSPKALPGFRDFYPDQLAEREHIFSTWRRIVRRYAFVEYDGPPLEPLELYTAKSGEEIVTQLYNFTDKGDRAISLRPEMTPTFARMVAARAQALRKPIRWFSVPQLFRYERAQRGRLREHFQLNVDMVGESDPLADAELLSVAVEIMRAFGLTEIDVRARVSDRRLLNALLQHHRIPETAFVAVYAVLDKFERQPKAHGEELLRNAGVSHDGIEAVLSFGELDFDTLRTRYGTSDVVAEHVARFAAYRSHLDALGIGAWVKFDLTIVRGLAYYTGIVFELFDAQGELRAICGGGRYDGLLSALGGVDLPALGFGMGDVVLGELLRARGLMPPAGTAPDVWIVQEPTQSDFPRTMLRTARDLREAGLSVEYTLHAQRGSKQLEAARKAFARNTVVIDDVTESAESSAPTRSFRVRTTDQDEQRFVSTRALVEHLAPLSLSTRF